MHAIDWCIIVGYFALVIGVSTWVTKRNKNTTDDYFLAGRNLAWWVIGASIFSSNIGSEHLVGLAGSGATDGVAMAHYELHAWCVLILGWVLIPFFMRGKVFTMPEFLERRFSPGCRTFLAMVSLISYVLTKVAVGIFAGGVVFSALMPEMHLGPLDSFWVGSIIVLGMAGIYVFMGGMRAVAYTDVLQVSVLVIGSALLTFFGLKALGGWDVLKDTLGSEMFNLWKPLIPAGVEGTWEPVKETGRMAWYFNTNYPWIGMLFCAPIVGLWYWCTDQYIVQRALGAPNQKEARRGCIFAGALKLLPVFIFILPGMICFALAKTGQYEMLNVLVNEDQTVNRAAAQGAFPLLIKSVLPIGVRGIVVAGLIAALMGSLAGTFNASSTLFTMDVYRRFKPNASQATLVWVGRLAVLAMVVIGLLWIEVIRGADGLYNYLQSVQGYLAPPIFVVFFMGIFWIVKFTFLPLGFTIPLLQMLFVLLTCFVPVLGYIYARKFRNIGCEGAVGFRKAFAFTFFMYMFASILTAAGHYIYFRFIDGGYLADMYLEQINALKSATAGELAASIDQLVTAFDTISSLSPLELTFQLMSQNVFYGIVLSLPTALFVMRKKK